MNAIGIGVGVLVVVFALLWAHWTRRLKPQIAGYGAQRMCPACGLITPRGKAACMECGKLFVSAGVGRGDRR
jgi:hypothetical protein